MTWKKVAVAVIPALALVLVASGNAQADLITNGGFESTANAPKNPFSVVQPTGWSGGLGGINFLCAPGTADNGSYLSVYPGFPATSPNGGNFYMADGDANFRSTAITQMVMGLTPGQQYEVSFYQAAGQQAGFTGATFEYWQVSFGSSTQNSAQMNTPSQGMVPWQAQTLTFTATSSSQMLSFLAIGGPIVNSLPPIVFLDGVSVNQVPTPEPASLAIMGCVLLGLGVAYRRQRAALTAAV